MGLALRVGLKMTYYTIIGEDFKLCKRSRAVRNIYFLSIYGNGRAKGANPP